MAKTLEDIFYKRGEKAAGVGTLSITTCDKEGCKTYTQSKSGVYCGRLGDLETIGKHIHVLNLFNKKPVRDIRIKGSVVLIDAFDGSGPISFPRDTKVFYEEWFMDRGSYMIWVEKFGQFGKLATEGDPVVVIE